MNKKMVEFLKNLDPDKIAQMAEEMEKELVNKEVQLKDFFNSLRFKEVWKQLEKEIDLKTVVSDNPYQEPLFGDVSNNELYLIFSIVFNPNIVGNLTKIEDLQNPFANESVIYNGLKFSQMHGQGTAYFVERNV